jgi:hypothetical protein
VPTLHLLCSEKLEAEEKPERGSDVPEEKDGRSRRRCLRRRRRRRTAVVVAVATQP